MPDPVKTLLLLVAVLVMGGAVSEVDPELRRKLAARLAEEHPQSDFYDAQVWLRVSDQRLTRFIDNPRERLEVLQLVWQEAQKNRLDPDLVLSLIEVESSFDRFAISRVGAQGLMQVMPFWRLEIGRPQDNLTHTATNLQYGTVILAHYIDVARGDLVQALARYHGSAPKTYYADRVLSAWVKRWRNVTRAEMDLLVAGCQRYALNACR